MLKSLEVFGFKSFADRTLFEFAPGVTCVVGPNGSGKSNVVDSIKWILGDQSAKSLRGKEMSDVIFNGSAGRKPSGFSEATLTFDNSQKLFPLDTDEVHIGRRLYRSGESEYLLNRVPVRLKDVRDLFMGTGAGTAAYSIIEQGRVDQILQSNPAARRTVFEEAAGISKYKARKVEAERRLERVAQNLARLTDIVDEVESQLNSTRSQASKAARYRELSLELKQAWTGLAADEFRFVTARLDHAFDELETLTQQLAGSQELVHSAEQMRRETEERLCVIDDLFLHEQRRLADSREKIATLEANIRHGLERCRDLESELSRIRREQSGLVLHDRDARQELTGLQEKLDYFAQEVAESRRLIETRQEQLVQTQAQVDLRRTQLQQRRKSLDSFMQRRAHLVEVIGGLKSQLAVLNTNEQALQQSLQQVEAEVQQHGFEFQTSQQELTQAEISYRNAQELVAGLQLRQGDMSDQASETDRRLQEHRERRSGLGARLAVLEEQEHRQEGVAIGVREILRRAEISRYPPWNTVQGVVRDLIDVPLEWAPVIEAALGERAQLIAVTRLEPWWDYLNRGPVAFEGRVGFVALDDASPADSNPSEHHRTESMDLSGEPGVINRADRLIESPRGDNSIASRVLADTWVVESMHVARQLIVRFGSMLRLVTLQGELLESSDRLYLGAMPHEGSLISRRSELRQLKVEVHQLDRAIESFYERHQVLATSLAAHSDEIHTAFQELRSSSSRVTEFTTRRSHSEQNLKRVTSQRQLQLHQLETVANQRQVAQQELDKAQSSLTDVEASLISLQGYVEDDEVQLQEIIAILDAVRQVIRDEQLALARHEERLGNLQESQARLNQEFAQRSQLRTETARRLTEATSQHRSLQLEMLHTGDTLASLFGELEQLLAANSNLARERSRLRSSRVASARQEEDLHRERRQLLDRQHRLELEIREARNQIKMQDDRIREEYQVSLEELDRDGVSAYRDLLLERFDPQLVEAQCQVAFGGAVAAPHVPEESSQAALEAALVPFSRPPAFVDCREELEARVDRLRRKLKSLGHVNTEALENLEDMEQRFAGLSGQLQDLLEAKAALEDIIRRINQESKRIFLDTFETIRVHFQELFRKLFGGGDADIILENPEDVLECGIDIVARPPGKELRSLSLLSGGEKTMTAVAMLFAMFKSKPSPYCILDEVDAALDEANVERYVSVVREFRSMTQFVIITHRKRTMTAADVMYGVTMEQAGVSKRMSVRFEEVGENGEIKIRGAA